MIFTVNQVVKTGKTKQTSKKPRPWLTCQTMTGRPLWTLQQQKVRLIDCKQLCSTVLGERSCRNSMPAVVSCHRSKCLQWVAMLYKNWPPFSLPLRCRCLWKQVKRRWCNGCWRARHSSLAHSKRGSGEVAGTRQMVCNGMQCKVRWIYQISWEYEVDWYAWSFGLDWREGERYIYRFDMVWVFMSLLLLSNRFEPPKHSPIHPSHSCLSTPLAVWQFWKGHQCSWPRTVATWVLLA